MCKPKELGVLGFKHLVHSIALLSKWVIATLDNPTSKWSMLFMDNINLGNWANNRQLHRKSYSTTDRILLGNLKSIRAMPYTIGIWRAWTTLQKHLTPNTHLGSLEPHWCVVDILPYLPGTNYLSSNLLNNVNSTLKHIGIKDISDL